MDAFLNIGSVNVKSTLKQLSGAPGFGTYRVNVTLEWTPTTQPDSFEGANLTLGGNFEVSFAQGGRRPLAQLQPFPGVAFPSKQQGAIQARVDLGANVSPAQLEAIEQERSGGPITLNLLLQGIVFRPESYAETELAPRTQPFWGELVYPVKPAEWLEVLQHFGYAQGFLLQVPKFASRASPKALEATTDLEKAIERMAEGRYKDAVAACRDALEIAYGDDDKNLHRELGYTVENIRAADKETRFWLARQAVWALTHAAKHRDQVTQAIQWERRDAVAVIMILSALLEQDPPV